MVYFFLLFNNESTATSSRLNAHRSPTRNSAKGMPMSASNNVIAGKIFRKHSGNHLVYIFHSTSDKSFIFILNTNCFRVSCLQRDSRNKFYVDEAFSQYQSYEVFSLAQSPVRLLEATFLRFSSLFPAISYE